MEDLSRLFMYNDLSLDSKPIDLSEEIHIQEEFLIALNKDKVEKDMIEFLTNIIMEKYNCDKDDVYKYWDDFKGEFRL